MSDLSIETRIARLEMAFETAPGYKHLAELERRVSALNDTHLDAMMKDIKERIKCLAMQVREQSKDQDAALTNQLQDQYDLIIREAQIKIDKAIEDLKHEQEARQAASRSKAWSLFWSIASILAVIIGANASQSRYVANVMQSLF